MYMNERKCNKCLLLKFFANMVLLKCWVTQPHDFFFPEYTNIVRLLTSKVRFEEQETVPPFHNCGWSWSVTMTSAGGTMSSKSRDGSGAADLLSWGLGELETRLVVMYWQVHVAETPTQVGVIKGACWFQQKSLEAGWASRKAGGSPVSKELDFVFALPFLSLASSQGWLSA